MRVLNTPLMTLAQRFSRVIPPFLETCFQYLLDKANLMPDIFKIPVHDREIDRFIHIIEASGDCVFKDNTSPHIVAAIITNFLQNIPNHILDDKYVSKWKEIPLVKTDDKEPYVFIRHYIKKIPIPNLLVLSRTLAFFKLFAKYEAITNVNEEQLSAILAPILIVDKENIDYVTSTEIVSLMIKNYKKIFLNCYSISKKKFISSKDFEESYFKNLTSELFTMTIKHGSPKRNDPKHAQRKMCRVIDVSYPNYERLIGNLLSRDRRAHALYNIQRYQIK